MKKILLIILVLSVVLSVNSKTYKEGELRDFDFGDNYISSDIREVGTKRFLADPTPLVDNTTTEDEQIAHALMQQIRDENRFVSKFKAEHIYNLPVGIVGSKEDDNYMVMVSNMSIDGGTTKLEVYMSFTLPQNGKKLAFVAKDVVFSAINGIEGDVKLQLASTVSMNFGKEVLMTVKPSPDTFVTFDCYGFKELGIHAGLEFSESMIKPDSIDVSNPKRVEAEFKTTATGWDDILVELSMPAFQLTCFKGTSMKVSKAVFDFSDKRNPSGIQFPAKYSSSDFIGNNKNTWRGVYISEAIVKLPRYFKRKGNKTSEKDSDTGGKENSSEKPETKGSRVTLLGKSMIIDKIGFTGIISGKDIFTIDEGDIGGWAYSLNQFSVKIEINEFIEGSMKGLIRVPIIKDGSELQYSAVISAGDNYTFNVGLNKPLPMSMFAAKITLKKGSNINVDLVDGEFKATATLHGDIEIAASTKGSETGSTDTGTHPTKLESGSNKNDSKKGLLLSGTFENMKVYSEAPYFDPGTMLFKPGNTIKGFPLQIKEFGIKQKKRAGKSLVGLYIHASINFTKAESGGFGGEGAFTLWARRDGATFKYKYDHLEISTIEINIKKGDAFELIGKINIFKDNPTYGSGFSGTVKAKFAKIDVSAKVVFGKVDGYRYWYADALAVLPTPIDIVPPVAAKGIGGGVYYHMRQKTAEDNASGNLGSSTAMTTGNKKAKNAVQKTLGQSDSGITYIPDKNIKLGFKGTLLLVLKGSEDAFNGDVTFEMNFNRHGGINQASFLGNAYFITPVKEVNVKEIKSQAKSSVMSGGGNSVPRPQKEGDKSPIPKRESTGAIYANIYILYDVPSETLHADAKVYVNAGSLQGVNEGGLAGHMVMHFDPKEWYIHIGTPTEPVGVTMFDAMETKAYFMMGHNMPPFPEPPDKVKEILGDSQNYSLTGEEDEFATGKGVAFGASFKLGTGDLNLPPFYANFTLGGGFDLMVRNYGEGARCKGRSGKIGINGWFAKGQIYAYVEGQIGIKVNLRFKKGKYDILDISAAALLQAKGPNPFWMKGVVGGHYRILGGLVKGNCRFSFEVGEKCEIIKETPLGGIDIISDMTPSTGEEDVSVFTSPQVVFNMAVGEEFEISEEGKKEYYKIVLDKFDVKSGGRRIPGTQRWNPTKDVVVFESEDVLPQKSDITVDVLVSFKQRIGGRWQTLKNEGKTVVETRNSVFKSGVAPDNIPLSNVKFSYPMIKQYNFYQDEVDYGYIRLKKGQSYLFEPDPEFKMETRFVAVVDGETINGGGLSYDNNLKQINFKTPQLSNDKIYQFYVMKVPKVANAGIDSNVKEDSTQVDLGIDGSDLKFKSKKAEGVVKALDEKEIINYAFRSSIYNTFSEKVDEIKFDGYAWTYPLKRGVHEMGQRFRSREYFDNYELYGNEDALPLVDIVAELSKTDWFNRIINPFVYKIESTKVRYRKLKIKGLKVPQNPEKLRYPYRRECQIRQLSEFESITNEDINTGAIRKEVVLASFMNMNSYYIHEDFMDFKTQLANLKRTGGIKSSSDVENILNKEYPGFKTGDYHFRLDYRLPDGSITSSKDLKMYNNVSFYD